MIADFADLCTYVYVLVDELYQLVAAPDDRRPGPPAAFTDSALITLTLTAELLGLDAETRFLAAVRRTHAGRFPLLPERARYHRRRRQRVAGTNRIRAALMARLWRVLAAAGRDRAVIDSRPVPVVGYHHAGAGHRWWGAADCGRVPAQKQTISGCKRHLLISHSGLILDFALAPANHHDGKRSPQLPADKAGLVVLGDKGYVTSPLQADLAARHDRTLLTPKRRNQREQLPEGLTRAINHCRQMIETVNSQLAGQRNLQRNRAKSVFGLCARVQAKLAAHTLGLYLNYLLGQPLLALWPSWISP